MDSASRAHPALARAQTAYWRTVEYPVFRRLVCFALMRPNLFTAAEALDYISQNELALWYGGGTELRELLAHIWPDLSSEQARSLTKTILLGPPRRIYRSDTSLQDVKRFSAGAIRERLAAIAATGPPLPDKAAAFLREAEVARLGESVPSPETEVRIRDLQISEIAEALYGDFSSTTQYCQQWKDLVSNDLQRAVDVLSSLANHGAWPTDVWAASFERVVMVARGGTATGVFSFVNLIVAAPDNILAENLHSVILIVHFLPTLWDPTNESMYWKLWDRVFNVAEQGAGGEAELGSVETTLNVPVGRLIEELFDWAAKYIEDADGEPFWLRLENACSTSSQAGRVARASASIHLAWLFGKRPEWTCGTLLPYFDWRQPDEAKLVWKCFIFGARFNASLWSALRKDFLATFDHLDQLDMEAVRVLYEVIGSIAVHEPTWLTYDEAQRLITMAPHIGRQQIAWILWTSRDAAAEKAGSLWRDRIGPWFAACWQLDEALKAPETSLSLIRVILATGDALPDAADAVVPRMSALDSNENAIFLLTQSRAPEQFPVPTVRILEKAINCRQRFYKGDLEVLLARIAGAWTEAVHDLRFRDLSEFAAG
jgi:hypothetical protein